MLSLFDIEHLSPELYANLSHNEDDEFFSLSLEKQRSRAAKALYDRDELAYAGILDNAYFWRYYEMTSDELLSEMYPFSPYPDYVPERLILMYAFYDLELDFEHIYDDSYWDYYNKLTEDNVKADMDFLYSYDNCLGSTYRVQVSVYSDRVIEREGALDFIRRNLSTLMSPLTEAIIANIILSLEATDIFEDAIKLVLSPRGTGSLLEKVTVYTLREDVFLSYYPKITNYLSVVYAGDPPRPLPQRVTDHVISSLLDFGYSCLTGEDYYCTMKDRDFNRLVSLLLLKFDCDTIMSYAVDTPFDTLVAGALMINSDLCPEDSKFRGMSSALPLLEAIQARQRGY